MRNKTITIFLIIITILLIVIIGILYQNSQPERIYYQEEIITSDACGDVCPEICIERGYEGDRGWEVEPSGSKLFMNKCLCDCYNWEN